MRRRRTSTGVPATSTATPISAPHPQERAAILHWVQNSAPPSFSQLLTVQSTGRRGEVVHRGVIHVSGSHSGADISSVTYTQVSESALAATATAAADYRGHGDAGDADVEALRTRASNPLGRLTLPPSIPADEVVPLKIYVAGYFGQRDMRSTEVDMRVPIGSGTRSVMYTVRFDADANAAVERLGEVGSGAGLTDIGRQTVQRARGFPAGGNAAALRSFWSSPLRRRTGAEPPPPMPAMPRCWPRWTGCLPPAWPVPAGSRPCTASRR